MSGPMVLHWGPEPMAPQWAIEVWEPVRGLVIADGMPNVELLVEHYHRYRNDERGRPWRRVLHGLPRIRGAA